MLHDFSKRCGDGRLVCCRGGGNQGLRPRIQAILGCTMLAFWLGLAGTAHGQVVAAGDAGRLIITAGATGTGTYLQYGERKMLGVTGFVDFDARSPFGVELEGRWLEWNQTAMVHAETYSIGPRYHKNFGKVQPYAKGLLGYGYFNFPYNLATGKYLIVTAGGGLDYHVTNRIYLRAVDVEYQSWPQFTYGTMSTFSVSTGLRVRVF
jgi:hypothetical protein